MKKKGNLKEVSPQVPEITHDENELKNQHANRLDEVNIQLESTSENTLPQINPKASHVQYKLRRYHIGKLAIFTVSFLIFFISTFVLMSKTIKEKDSTNVVTNVAKIMTTKPIMDLLTVLAHEECPNDYERLDLGNWPGTVEGCYCGNHRNAGLHKGECSSKDIDEYQCENVDAMSSLPLDAWFGSSFCVKRFTDFAWRGPAGCPEGYMDCGGSICPPASLATCPVLNLFPKEYNSKPIKEPHAETRMKLSAPLYYEPTQPLIFLQIDTQGTSCLSSDEMNYDRSQYKLINIGKNSCPYGESSAAVVVDSSEEYGVYEDNGMSDIVEKLPLYSEATKANELYLNEIHRFQLIETPECKKDFFDDLVTLLDELENSKKDQNAFTKMAMAYFLVMFILFGFQYCPAVTRKLSQKRVLILHIFSNVLLMILSLIILSAYNICTKGMDSIENQNDAISSYVSNNCIVDEGVNSAFGDFQDEVIAQNSRYWSRANVLNVLSIILLILMLLDNIFLRCVIKKKL